MSGARESAIVRSVTGRAPSFQLRWPSPDVTVFLLVGSMVAGCAGVLAVTQIGSGDYGQWLMAARTYLDEGIPAYRADAAVPPVVPLLIAWMERMVGDPTAGIHLFAVLLLSLLAGAAFACAATLFRSRMAGLGAVIVSLLLTDRFLELFAFGGLLQAAAIVLLWLAIAAFVAAGRDREHAWLWWAAGAVCAGAGPMTHIGTAAISVPVSVTLALIIAHRQCGGRRRWVHLAPLGAAMLFAAVYYVVVLAPGGTELTRNPASIGYRGPVRLLESLTDYWPTSLVIGLAAIGLVVGVTGEAQRRRIGPWTLLAVWTAITVAVVAVAILGEAATDYPRFATLILAPLVPAAAAALVQFAGAAATAITRTTRRGARDGWMLGALTLVVLVFVPATVSSFEADVMGYRLTDQDSLTDAAAWIAENVPPGGTVLAPVREAKWVEGLTGRAALFSGPVRYSFRAEEWQRSFAADALLRSNGALINEFFFARFTDAAGSRIPREMTIAANHGGEYVDLLRTVFAETRIISGPSGSTLASLQNLAPSAHAETTSLNEARVALGWEGDRQGTPLSYHQAVTLLRGSSTLQLNAVVSTVRPTGGFMLTLRPAGAVPLISTRVFGHEADLTFGRVGASEPRLRVVVGGGGHLTASADGSLRVQTDGSRVHVLVTDLTGATAPSTALQTLHPADIVREYGVSAALLVRDGTFDARRARLAVLGFRVVATFGPYAVLLHDGAAPTRIGPPQ